MKDRLNMTDVKALMKLHRVAPLTDQALQEMLMALDDERGMLRWRLERVEKLKKQLEETMEQTRP